MCSELEDLWLVQERSEMLKQVETPKHCITTTTRHLSKHSTAQQHCLHTGLAEQDQGKLHRTTHFLLLFVFFIKTFLDIIESCWLMFCASVPAATLKIVPALLGMLDTCNTLLVHCLTVLMSSWMTRSTHLRHGVFSLTICFFTMTSNARSGVNSPVLRMHGETEVQQQTDGTINRHVSKKQTNKQNDKTKKPR